MLKSRKKKDLVILDQKEQTDAKPLPINVDREPKELVLCGGPVFKI